MEVCRNSIEVFQNYIIVRQPESDDDFKGIFELRRKVLDESIGRLCQTELSKEDIMPGALHMAAFGYDGTVASAVRMIPYTRNRYMAQRMATLPDYQRRGLAGLVLSEAEMAVIEKTNRKIGGFILHSRLDAVSFYKKMGYVLTGENIKYDNGPHPEMIKNI